MEQVKRAEGLVHLDAIKKQIPKIYENIVNPAVRSSFKTLQLVDLKGKQLRFVATAQFHLQKVRAPAALVEIEAAIQTVLGQEFHVVFDLEEAMAPQPLDVKALGWDTVEEPL